MIFSFIITSLFLSYKARGFSYGMFHALSFGDLDEELFKNRIMNAAYKIIMYPMLLALLPVVVVSLFNRKNVKLCSFSLIFILYYCLLLGRRFPLLYLIVDLAIGLVFWGERIAKKTILKIEIIIIIMFVIIFLFTAWRKDAFKTGNWEPVYETFFLYLNLCLPVGDYWISRIDMLYKKNWLLGYSFSRALIDNLDLVFRFVGVRIRSETLNRIIEMPQNEYIYIGNGNRANAFATWVYYLYIDFRWVGVLAGSYLWGLMSTIKFIKILRTQNFYRYNFVHNRLYCIF